MSQWVTTIRTVRFFGVFSFLLVLTLSATYLAVTGDEDAARLADAEIPTPPPTPTPTPQPTPTPVATPTPEPTPTPVLPETVTVVFTGEVLSHSPVITQAAAYGDDQRPYDYRPMFAQVAPLLQAADLAVCHVETPVSADNANLSGYPIFNAPSQMPEGLKASGYDTCSTASNHSYDKGPSGIVATLDQMDAAGLGHFGMARSAEERDAPTLYEVGGVTIGHLSYTYGLNGFVLPSDQPYLVNVTGVDAILADAAATRQAGADIVILSIQWGNEYQVAPSQTQIDQATAFLQSDDIDLIMGAHVHVVQPVDVINGKYVVYGLGNFLSNQSANCCPAASQNGIMAYIDITGTPDDGYEIDGLSFVPTRVDRDDYTIVPLPQALASDDLSDAVRSLYESVIADTTAVVESLGVDVPIRDFGS